MRTDNKNRYVIPLTLATAVAASTLSASAFSAVVISPTLDFNIAAPTSGSISFAGGTSAALIGSDIQVDSVVGLGADANNGVTLSCIDCVLNFETGNYTGASNNQWLFSGGGSIMVTGSLDTTGDGVADIANETLLYGSFKQASNVSFDAGNLMFNIAAGTFADTKNADLLAYYSLPDGDYLGGMNISFTTAAGADPVTGDAFTSSQVLSGDIANSPVPLPAAVWLLVSGLLGLTGFYRRNRKA